MTPDQSLIWPNNLGAAINEGFRYVAQTYTAGAGGTLAGIFLGVQSQSSHALHVAIRGVKDGVPDSTVLGEINLGASAPPPWPVPVIFPQEVSQVAGEQYAIVVHYPDAPPAGAGQGQGTWTGATGDAYPGGKTCMSTDGDSWRVEDDNDLHFQTFIKNG
jgi:hypothetical protein